MVEKDVLADWVKRHKVDPIEAKEILRSHYHQKSLDAGIFHHDFSGKHLRVGVLGDQHFGNRWTVKPYLRDVYRAFKKANVEAIYNTGDMTDGPWQRHGNILEQYAHGIENQVSDFVRDYPCIDGVRTYLIDGNHDGWYRKMGAGTVGKLIAAQRGDIEHLGSDEATVMLGKVSIMLSHPDDGSAYAYSYKPQKQIESMFKMGEKMPNVILQGHYHKIFQMNFGGVHYFCTGTTERQTPWMRGKKISADLGAWILDIYRDQRGHLTRLESTLLPYNGDKHSIAVK